MPAIASSVRIKFLGLWKVNENLAVRRQQISYLSRKHGIARKSLSQLRQPIKHSA